MVSKWDALRPLSLYPGAEQSKPFSMFGFARGAASSSEARAQVAYLRSVGNPLGSAGERVRTRIGQAGEGFASALKALERIAMPWRRGNAAKLTNSIRDRGNIWRLIPLVLAASIAGPYSAAA